MAKFIRPRGGVFARERLPAVSHTPNKASCLYCIFCPPDIEATLLSSALLVAQFNTKQGQLPNGQTHPVRDSSKTPVKLLIGLPGELPDYFSSKKSLYNPTGPRCQSLDSSFSSFL